MALDPKDTPPLCDAADLIAPKQPVEQATGSKAKTAFVKIDLGIAAPTAAQKADGQIQAKPMTMVFAPDPSILGTEVDVLLWFTGWKKDSLDGVSLPGLSIQEHLNHPKFKLRDFILGASKGKKKFLFVAPTLGDRSQYGILNQEDQLAAFIQQAINAAKTHLGANVAKVGNIVIGAHSGGGLLLNQVINFNGSDFKGKINDVWCVDCTYQGGNDPAPVKGKSSNAYTYWASTTPDKRRLFVFSTGKYGHAAINPATMRIGKDGQPVPGTGQEFKVSADHPAVRFPHETAYDAKIIYDFAITNKLQNVEVRINSFYEPAGTAVGEAEKGPFDLPKPFPYAIANEHNKSVSVYFPLLVDDSAVLK